MKNPMALDMRLAHQAFRSLVQWDRLPPANQAAAQERFRGEDFLNVLERAVNRFDKKPLKSAFLRFRRDGIPSQARLSRFAPIGYLKEEMIQGYDPQRPIPDSSLPEAIAKWFEGEEDSEGHYFFTYGFEPHLIDMIDMGPPDEDLPPGSL